MVTMPPNVFDSDHISPKRVVSHNAQQSTGSSSTTYVSRPTIGQNGRKILLLSNHFLVDFDPDLAIYHYDIVIEMSQGVKITETGDDCNINNKLNHKLSHEINRRVIRKIVKQNSGRDGIFHKIVPAYDGNKNMFTVRPISGIVGKKSIRLTTELTNSTCVESQLTKSSYVESQLTNSTCVESQLTKSSYVESEFVVKIKFTGNVISLNTLKMYFENKSKTQPCSAIRALDIVLRQGLTMSKIEVGSSFYEKEENDRYRYNIGGGKQLSFGFFQTLRACSGVRQHGRAHLVVDTSSTVFYARCTVEDLVRKILPGREGGSIMNSRMWSDYERKRVEKELKGLQIEVTHLKYRRTYTVHGLSHQSASETYFDWYERTSGGDKVYKGNVSVAEYFKTHHLTVTNPHSPCVTVRQGRERVYLPVEVCVILSDQPVSRRKLSACQVSDLTRTCSSTQPKQRFHLIQNAVKEIIRTNQSHSFSHAFSLSVTNSPVYLSARVLDTPPVREKNNKLCCQHDGKWRINHFFVGADLKKWIVVNIGNLDDNVTTNAIDMFVKQATQLGMHLNRPMCRVTMWHSHSLREKLFEKAIEKYKQIDLIFFIGIETDDLYCKIKHYGDVEFGITTQCVKKVNVLRLNQSIVTNILLKINAKLGGQNVIVENLCTNHLMNQTLVVGIDIAHPAQTVRVDTAHSTHSTHSTQTDKTSSIAALVGSIDTSHVRYYATVRVQPRCRDEIVNDVFDMLKEVLLEYEKRNNYLPTRIIIYRDGVSEAQFDHVVQLEIDRVRQGVRLIRVDYQPKITFVIVQKRHHTRFVPDDTKDGVGQAKNIPPGTVVDSIVVNQHDFDFYLCSHKAIQGTSRPAHYYVLYDDNNFDSDQLQSITYSLCHTYARCTQSISIPAAVYYAHLAAFRARVHMEWSSHTDSGSGSPNQSMSSRSSRKNIANFENLSEKIAVKPHMKSSMYFC